MTALIQEFETISSIRHEIEQHPAWIGHVSGLKAEKMLRKLKKPYFYVLRGGESFEINENETHYYVSFILPNFSVKHQPFVITSTTDGWYFENAGIGGPFTEASIDDVLHLIMHCHKDENTPFVQF